MNTKPAFLSHFTPSLMTRETLEAIFVQREALADRLVEHIRDSVLTPQKHYALLIGPRGIGKSHLIALTYYRIKAMDDLRGRLRIAWMREEEWGITSFLDLLLRIFRALQSEYPDDLPQEQLEQLYKLSPGAAEHRAAELLKEFVGASTLLLLIENLDDVFEGLAEAGQKRLRSFLQENRICTILATSQGLFKGVSRPTAPFYNFFNPQYLQGLGIEDVIHLLTNIACLKGDTDLASFIQTPTGRARIRAVDHLAGGNHRIYVILSEFLKRESLDELVQPFMNMLDELTPYYQARMKWISTQQRKIVEFLCDQRGAVPVKEIAQRGFMAHQTVTGQLKKLLEMGYVNSTPVGRESYYELREPLMRLCIEVKKNRGVPIRLFVDFLRLWYTRDDLQQRIHSLKPEAMLEREYMLCALREIEEGSEDPRVTACLKDFNSYYEQENWSSALTVAEELVAIRGNVKDWIERGHCFFHLEQWEGMLESYNEVIDRNLDHAGAWAQRAVALFELGRYEDALSSFDRALKISPKDSTIWLNLAISLAKLRRNEEALTAFDKGIEFDSNEKMLWFNRGVTLTRSKQYEEAAKSYNKALDINPHYARAWYMQGFNLGRLGLLEEALVSYDRAIEFGGDMPCLFFERAEMLLKLGRCDESCAALKNALHQFSHDKDHVAGHTVQIAGDLFHSTSDTTVWQTYLKMLVKLYEEYHILSVLGQGLVGSIPTILRAIGDGTAAHDWLTAWREVAGDRIEMELPLRLAETALRYRETHDQRILLELPAEERSLLEDLLREEEQAPENADPKLPVPS